MWAHCLNCIEIPRKKKNTGKIQNAKGTLKFADNIKMGGAVNSSRQKGPVETFCKEIRVLDNHQLH